MAFRRRSTKRPSGGGTGGGRGSYLAQTAGGTKTRDQDKKRAKFATGSDSSDGNRGAYIASTQGGTRRETKKQPTGTSFGPAGQVGADQRLQMLVDRKDELKNLPGGMGDDRNLYQVMMNQFKNQNAQNRSAYASRFPISNFFTSGLPNIASKFMPGAGVLSLLANIGGKIKSGLTRASDVFDGGSDPAVLTSGVRQGPPAYDASGLAGYQDAIMKMAQQKQTPMTVYDPSMFDPTQADFRQNMAGTEPYNPAPDVFNQESVDPLQAAKDQQDKMMQMYGPREPQGPSGLAFGFPSQFQEGGLASINNPQYNMLMKASNFDV